MTRIRKIRFHRFGDNEVLQLDEVEQSGPDARQILVAVRAASVNPVDFKIRSGKYPSVKDDRLPYTPGRDISGIVLQCGPQVDRVRVGDEVIGMVPVWGGGYAEQVVLEERAIAIKPAGIDHIHAAAIPLAGQTAHQGLFRHGQLRAGESVLIHGGSGGVGHFAVQFAKASGARVLTTVSTEHVTFARSLGADVVIDYKNQRFEDAASDVDLVFDLIDGETRERSWAVLKQGGRLISTLTAPSQDRARAAGVKAMRYTVEPDGDELSGIGALIATGNVRPHVEKSFPLEQAMVALASVERGHSAGKVVLAVS
ncbi:NADP-dependent oxidoreductase [Bradyrhizobium cytisi]|uniref:NADP-dependent oxidoreductase n=1 Tax=Bradyrhizobium cytisi TaxID=515489 RepID=A0A5S4X1B3_9BRAD|nr:NADP-dependent oxidoreductase [Bradyrhizobium cytisi]TYL83334.1 NADP-dependent oxidoreductase [Bradyrhizobium cytisi]